METIDEYKNIIRDEKLIQEDLIKQIKSLNVDIEKSNETINLAEIRIQNYEPYEVNILTSIRI